MAHGNEGNEYWTICSAYHTQHWSHNLIRNYQVARFPFHYWTFLPLPIPSPYRTSLLATDWWLFIPQNMIKERWRQGYYYQWYILFYLRVFWGHSVGLQREGYFFPPFIRHLYLFSYFTDERAITNPAVDINVIMAGLLYHITSLKHFIGRIMVYTESCSFHVETVR